MKKNATKARLNAGETVFGVFVPLYSPTVVELFGLGGFDFVLIDCEHGPMVPETVENMVRAAEYGGATPLVRVAQNERQVILRYLDIGTQGVHIPMISTRAEAQAVVAAVKYPPQGVRGLAGVRANDYGATQSMADYVKIANEETLVVCHIETRQAIEHLREIATVEGLDVIFVGPTDLSSSLGYPGQYGHPLVRDAIADAIKTIVDTGKIAGTMARDIPSAREYMGQGARYVTIGASPLILRATRDFTGTLRSP